MLPCMLLCAQFRDLLSCRGQAPGGVRLVAGGRCHGATKVLANNERKFGMVWKELGYGTVETLGDAEEVARGWRYNLVQ